MRSAGTKVLPAARALGTVGLVVGGFELGWKIGTGIRTKFLRIGVPSEGPPAGSGWGDAQFMQPVTRGGSIALNTNLAAPEDGFRWAYSVPGQTWWGRVDTNNGCGGYHPDVPASFERMTATGGWCYNGAQISGGFIAERALGAPGAIEDYSGQPFDRETTGWAEAPATREQLDTRTRSALDSGDYPMLNLWYAHVLDPENYADPTTQEREDHRCDRTTPAYKNPGGSANPDPHEPKLITPLVAPIRPSGAQNAADPYLRYGEAAWTGEYRDSWSGWGWRHIQAAHGWGPEDETATRQAMAVPAVVMEQSSTSMRYIGMEYTQNGVVCQRIVVVEYGEHPGDPPDKPKGIITSYGKFVRPVP